MPTMAEFCCPPSDFVIEARVSHSAAGGGHDIVTTEAWRHPERGPRGYRGRFHRGTLGCEVSAPPARGEDGPVVTAPHGGPGV
jgi:hypothetical protein